MALATGGQQGSEQEKPVHPPPPDVAQRGQPGQPLAVVVGTVEPPGHIGIKQGSAGHV